MKDRLSLLDYLTVAIFGLQTAFAVHVGLEGPTAPILPLHWNSAFEADRWGTGPEFAAFLGGMALIGLIVSGGLGLGALRARAEGDPSRARSLRLGQGMALSIFTILGLLTAAQTLRDLPPDETADLSMAGLSLIILAMGAVLGRVHPNPLVGVRTPWTYKSRLAWDRANRLAGRLFFMLGLGGLMAAPLTPQPTGALAMIGLVLSVAVLSVIESWRVWRDDPDRQPF